MEKEYIKIKADEDDCIYQFDVELQKWQKVSDIKSIDEIPKSVKNKVRHIFGSVVSTTTLATEPLTEEEINSLLFIVDEQNRKLGRNGNA
jgi:hypothetical protein